MRGVFTIFLSAALVVGLAACQTDNSQDASGEYSFGSNVAFLLPPGHPGFVSGNLLVLPSDPGGPAIHAANCFAGVQNDMEIGVGSVVGVTSTYLGAAVLPVNINLGTRQLGHYKIKVESMDPAVVDFDLSAGAVIGSIPQLASTDCLQRGCPSSCTASGLYPPQFTRAPGFEHVDVVVGGAGWVSVETTNFIDPATGVVNLCNIKILVKDTLPGPGVALTFTVEALDDTGLNDISGSALVLDGIVIEHSQLQ